jgi:hypothetical protein
MKTKCGNDMLKLIASSRLPTALKDSAYDEFFPFRSASKSVAL